MGGSSSRSALCRVAAIGLVGYIAWVLACSGRAHDEPACPEDPLRDKRETVAAFGGLVFLSVAPPVIVWFL